MATPNREKSKEEENTVVILHLTQSKETHYNINQTFFNIVKTCSNTQNNLKFLMTCFFCSYTFKQNKIAAWLRCFDHVDTDG